MSESKTTSLYDFHLSKNAKVIDFAGWSMPFSYDGTLKEHHYVRESAGYFDVSHMGRLRLSYSQIEEINYLICSDLKNINKLEKGGLSGKPIEIRSNELIKKFYKLIGKKIKIFGVGGASTAEGVFEKIISGATLVQLYTGMVYQGPKIALKISNDLIDIVKRKGLKNISEAIGTKN